MEASSDMPNGILARSENCKMEFVVIWISLSAELLPLYTDLLVNSPGIFGMLGGSCIGVKGRGMLVWRAGQIGRKKKKSHPSLPLGTSLKAIDKLAESKSQPSGS